MTQHITYTRHVKGI